jgi:hypothetical protein
MSFNIKLSHEGKFHEWTKVLPGQEAPMSKIKQGERSICCLETGAFCGQRHLTITTRVDAMIVTATAKAPQAGSISASSQRCLKKRALGAKNTFLGKTLKK